MPEEGKVQKMKDKGKIVLKTAIHCKDCRSKVYNTLLDYPGVEDVTINLRENKATVKAPKVDANKLFESVKKKREKKIIMLLYPDPTEVKKKEKTKKEEGKGQEKKDKGKIVLEIKMHSKDCRSKVYNTLLDYPGVEDVTINLQKNKATVKAPKVDANELFESVKKESKGRIIKLLYPDPTEVKKKKKTKKKMIEITMVLKTNMDWSSYKQRVENAALQIKDVQSVKLEGQTLTVQGLDLDPQTVCDEFIEKSGEFAELVTPKKNNNEKKGDEKEDDSIRKDEKQTLQIIYSLLIVLLLIYVYTYIQ